MLAQHKYQAKFRSSRRSPSSNELNNFWSEAEYASQRLVIANSMTLPDDVERRNNAIFILGYLFDQLDEMFFEFLFSNAQDMHNNRVAKINLQKKYKPREYQKPIIKACVDGFKRIDRGKIIAACAAGKTLISLWISEEMESNAFWAGFLKTNKNKCFRPNCQLVKPIQKNL